MRQEDARRNAMRRAWLAGACRSGRVARGDILIERDLTEKQRRVLFMMVFNDVPMDEVVQHLGANRNAIYKMLHDARRKLKNGLQSRGFEVGETLALFGAPR